MAEPTERMAIGEARRRLLIDSAGIAVSAAGFGFVYGLAAHGAGLSVVETVAMNLLVFAGAAEFAALGYITQGLPWATILLLTGLLNARHLLYSASLAPRLRHVPRFQRALMAQVLTDESFALSSAHFQRLGRTDAPGFWIAALGATWVPWNVATLAGFFTGGAVADPARFGLDVVFPAAMAGLGVGLLAGRREIIAGGAGAVIAVACSLAFGPGVGIVAGGLLGPAVALAAPLERPRRAGRVDRRPDA